MVISNLLPAATIVTTIEVVVEELCSNTVPKIPMLRPANGFEITSSNAKAFPKLYVKGYIYISKQVPLFKSRSFSQYLKTLAKKKTLFLITGDFLG